jgi:hypothetical protein
MTEGNASPSPQGTELNEFQARRLCVTCQYVDRLLSEIEGILDTSDSKSAFPRYSDDVPRSRRRALEGCISELRAQLLRTVENQGLPKQPPIPGSRAIQAAISAIDIAVEELKPHYMRGYGDLSEGAAAQLNDIVSELQSLVSKLVDNFPAE